MIPMARFLRLHVAGTVVVAVFSASILLSILGFQFAVTILGWALGVFWTVALLFEAGALGAERWLQERSVSKRFAYMSLVLLLVPLLFQLPVGLLLVVIPGVPSVWWIEYQLPVQIELNFGGNYAAHAERAAFFILQWGLLIGCLVSLRRLFRSTKHKEEPISKWFLILVLLFGLGTALPILNVTDDILKTLGVPRRDEMFNPTRISSGLMPTIFVVTLFIQFGILSAWIPKTNIRRILLTFLPVILLWSAPFFYGLFRYGPTAKQMVEMEYIYVIVTLAVPLLTWLLFTLSSRGETRSVSAQSG
jgi:hypothetical protein